MKLFLMLAMLASCANAFAENEKGNGGAIHFCPDETDPNKKHELYDLFEGREVNPAKRDVIEVASNTTKEEIIKSAIERIRSKNKWLAIAVEDALKDYYSHLTYNPKLQLALTIDANRVGKAVGCEIVPMINWYESFKTVYRDDTLYYKMTPLNQAASDLHEAVYRAARVFSDVANSDPELFSSQPLTLDALLFPRQEVTTHIGSTVQILSGNKLWGGFVKTIHKNVPAPWLADGYYSELQLQLAYGCKDQSFQIRATVTQLFRKKAKIVIFTNGKGRRFNVLKTGDTTDWVDATPNPDSCLYSHVQSRHANLKVEIKLCGNIYLHSKGYMGEDSGEIHITRLIPAPKIEME